MGDIIFLAGASGAIGTALIPRLRRAGYHVYGTTRRAARAPALEALGCTPVIVDVFDAKALAEAVQSIAPVAVVHQLTDLPQGLDPRQMAEAPVRNARVRAEGTRNLVAASVAAGVRHIVAQSIAWAYAPGQLPYTEKSPLEENAEGTRKISVGGVIALEQQVLCKAAFKGTVLRYGQLYGPGTGVDKAAGASPVHVDDAAAAALLALQRSPGGVFNIAEDNDTVSTAKAYAEFGWRPMPHS